ncbi:hypothetical protein HYPBUDRAFT_165195 [Hyphopichia burtonii NRRL Y-1933]|uniref:SPX-domain-containing protein n=1 Tax=Hyphopichia burtonii NRRL Y-1933 TaxID=984485 RepID=A0A1E4RMD6_9ASCO|nr:hypothetical protein HYPBUDRAFT_165195 [Hyphopichia burtonii NRRL Y-1933]ODV68430.1 hypothetical protein HYPBUDRAFT_165195 [Hyphopichia burtonii NRRL Y-1933]
MKFGKYLASRQLELPEYSGHFIDYKALKKLIKQLAKPATASKHGIDTPLSQDEIQQTLKENKASFFFRVERELDKVNSFYLEKQANLAVNLDLLVMKRDELFSKSKEHTDGTNNTNNSNANFKKSISYLNLYQNFKKIHQDLIRLQQFIELNETGFSKVVKKWDKRSKSHTKELFISTAVSVQPVFHKNEINDLSDLVTQSLFDLESIMDGDYSALDNYSGFPNKQYLPHPGFSRTNSTSNIQNEQHERHGSVSSNFQSRHGSIVHSDNNEIDELYSSFVNVATIKDTDLSVLSRWIDKVRSPSKQNNDDDKLTSETKIQFSSTESFKLSKIFLLSISNLKISDNFLESFLKLIDYQLDFGFISDDFNNNKNVIHECCSIALASTHESSQHVLINNGVKVLNSTDSIDHSRKFIVEYIVNKVSPKTLQRLLICRDFNGRNCLHYASQNNRLDLLDIILPYFPKNHIDDLDNESMSALLLAIKHGNFEIIKKLVQMGSNCSPKLDDSKLQYLPINYVCKYGDFQTVEFLLSSCDPNTALVNQQDVEGLLPLHVLARSGHYKLIKLLIQYGADVNKLDGLNKWPPLFYAALEGHVKTTQELVNVGAKLDIIDEDGYNVLYYCVVEGHIDVLNQLLTYHRQAFGNKNFPPISPPSIIDKSSMHSSSSLENSTNKDGAAMSILDEGDDSEDSGGIEKGNVESIPHLELPPPILPLRRYGHNFLEQKVLIELIFPNDSDFINLFNSTTDLKPGRITLTSNISDIVPRNILLPVADEAKANNKCIFQTDIDSLNEFRIDFEVFPKFGTRLIAKTTALAFSQIDTSSPEISSIQLPLFDLRLKNIGELKFNYQVIFPFSGNLLETSKFDTYWKSSTNFVKNNQTLKLNAAGGLSPTNFLSPSSLQAGKGVNINQNISTGNGNSTNIINTVTSTSELKSGGGNSSSFVTATSLSGEYLRIKICLLNDGTPVVCPHWSIPVTENIDLYLPNLSLEQLNSMTDNLFDYRKVIHDLSKMTKNELSLIKKLLKIIYLPLDIFLDILNVEINLNLELIFPSLYELENLPFVVNIQLNLNSFIDMTLNDVFNHIRSLKIKYGPSLVRSIIFLSSNSLVCKIVNWKQPNFPVFLVMNGVVYNTFTNEFESRTTNGLMLNDLKDGTTTDLPLYSSNNSKNKVRQDRLLANDQELTIRSIKEAVNFTINNNLIGLITSIHLLNLVPKLIPLIRSRGLILVASNDIFDLNDDESTISKELDCYTKTEINGLRFDDVLSFKEDITM